MESYNSSKILISDETAAGLVRFLFILKISLRGRRPVEPVHLPPGEGSS
jgi:hypothetical protein